MTAADFITDMSFTLETGYRDNDNSADYIIDKYEGVTLKMKAPVNKFLIKTSGPKVGETNDLIATWTTENVMYLLKNKSFITL